MLEVLFLQRKKSRKNRERIENFRDRAWFLNRKKQVDRTEVLEALFVKGSSVFNK